MGALDQVGRSQPTEVQLPVLPMSYGPGLPPQGKATLSLSLQLSSLPLCIPLPTPLKSSFLSPGLWAIREPSRDARVFMLNQAKLSSDYFCSSCAHVPG